MNEKEFKEKLEKLKDLNDLDKFKLEQTNELINKLKQLRLSFNG